MRIPLTTCLVLTLTLVLVAPATALAQGHGGGRGRAAAPRRKAKEKKKQGKKVARGHVARARPEQPPRGHAARAHVAQDTRGRALGHNQALLSDCGRHSGRGNGAGFAHRRRTKCRNVHPATPAGRPRGTPPARAGRPAHRATPPPRRSPPPARVAYTETYVEHGAVARAHGSVVTRGCGTCAGSHAHASVNTTRVVASRPAVAYSGSAHAAASFHYERRGPRVRTEHRGTRLLLGLGIYSGEDVDFQDWTELGFSIAVRRDFNRVFASELGLGYYRSGALVLAPGQRPGFDLLGHFSIRAALPLGPVRPYAEAGIFASLRSREAGAFDTRALLAGPVLGVGLQLKTWQHASLDLNARARWTQLGIGSEVPNIDPTTPDLEFGLRLVIGG